MKIRRFFAKDMRSALNNVSKELGADAAILSSQRVNGGVEVVAATDYEEALLYNQQASSSAPTPSTQEHSSTEAFIQAAQQRQHRGDVEPSTSRSPARADKPSQRAPEHREYRDEERFPAYSSPNDNRSETAANEPAYPALHQIEWSQEPTLVAMREELNLLRTMLQQQVAKLANDKRSQESPIGVALESALEELGLSRDYLQKVVQQCEQDSSFDSAWQKALALTAKDILVADDDIIKRGGVVALVGPTGVGKTTTIAKLAAKQVLKDGADSVALITTDSYRIAAHEQIKTYGRILQIPVRAVNDEASFREALYHFSEKKLVLIDTAGMSHYDERMQQLMQVLSNDTVKIRNYLVLSATSQAPVLKESISLFSRFAPQGCIVTKIDEAASLGEIISTIIKHRLKVTYTTDGQRVPEDIRIARAHHLVSKMVWVTRHRHSSSASEQTQKPNRATGTR